jgi:hypothetical protein
MPFENNFQRLSFSSNIIEIRECSMRWSIEKAERKGTEKERKRKKRKPLRAYSNKNGKSIF